MISYQPFYRTLTDRGLTEYALIHRMGVSANTLYRIKKGEAISTRTLGLLCALLHCRVEEVLEYIRTDNESGRECTAEQIR